MSILFGLHIIKLQRTLMLFGHNTCKNQGEAHVVRLIFVYWAELMK